MSELHAIQSRRSSFNALQSTAKLVLASDGVPDDAASVFLVARARAPEATARALRAVSEIVASRFYVPPRMLARILREADPVATVGPGAVRFEGFSACCSAYIRLDMEDDALEVWQRSRGTTNVDFGPELRAALARVRRDSAFEITIGADSVAVAHESAAVTEEKVPLPIRWVKGFGEVQLHLRRMRKAGAVPRIAAHRFLRAQPRSQSDHLQWITLARQAPRVAARRTDGAVPLRGAHRLRVLEPLMAFATELEVWVDDMSGSSAWVLHLGPQRITLALNAEPWRGFSGDGGLLAELIGADDPGVAALRAQLAWQDRLSPTSLSDATGLRPDRLEQALAVVATEGLVGFDLSTSAYFHRVLPFRLDRMERLNPRLKSARKLFDAGAVTLGTDVATVSSDGVVHELRITAGQLTCTCPWYAKHKGARGPCKHALAVELAMEAAHD
ncbi:MAG: SWIM zinc finger family protein [Pseudomonadota bacterium]